MPEYTQNLNLVKPAKAEQYNVADFNNNMDKIDNFAGLTPSKALAADKLIPGRNINGVLFDGTKNVITGIGLHSMTETYSSTNVVYGFDESNQLSLFRSKQDANTGHALTETDWWEEVNLGGSGLEIGDIGIALEIDETKGLRRYLNGQLVTLNANTQGFFNWLKTIVGWNGTTATLKPNLVMTEQNWQAAKTASAYGQVGAFVIDDEAQTIRLPAVVNIQGVFDLQNVGLTVKAGLPNIEGTVTNHSSYGMMQDNSATGAFYAHTELANGLAGNSGNEWSIGFDASRFNAIYGNSDTVQQEAIQYPYFIQIATGQETEVNITNEIELNNPFSLLDYKYSEYELNNLSWLKSTGQYNSKAIYPAVYDLLLKIYNGTETKAGVSVKLSTGSYTDYDFVLNTAEEAFRLPVKVKQKFFNSGDVPVIGNGMSLGWTNGSINYGSYFNNGSTYDGVQLDSRIFGNNLPNSINNKDQTKLPKDSQIIGTTTDPTKSGLIAKLSSTEVSGLYLYFYVGETVQNANLINAGRIEEVKANKADIDGVWVNSYYQVFTDVSYTAGQSMTYSLSDYLPNDGNIYEVIFSGKVTTGSSAGDTVNMQLETSVFPQTSSFVACQTPNNRSMFVCASTTVPVGADRNITISNASAADTATLQLRLNGYRKVR